MLSRKTQLENIVPDGTLQTAPPGPLVEVMKEFNNVMAELTLTPVPNGIIEWLCGEVGSNRVLFGTDAPMRDPRPQLAWCVYTRLDAKDKKNILGANFARTLSAAVI